MQRTRKILLGKVAVVGAAIPFILWAYEYGPDPGYCGVPGEAPSACIAAGCHVGTVNSPSNRGSVSVTFPGDKTYVPGVKQHLKVTIADPVQAGWGFQLTARLASNPANMAGSFVFTDANTTLMCSLQNRQNFSAQCQKGFSDSCNSSSTTCAANFPLQYIEHSLTGFNSTRGPNSATYEFDWTPPASNVGNVTIYVAGNAGPPGQASADNAHIYTTTYTLTPGSAGGPPSISANGVVSAGAFGGYTSVAPGSWMEIFGNNLAATERTWATGDFSGTKAPTTLDGVKVTIGGKDAFIDFISKGQVNAQVPSDVAAGSQQIVVTTPGGTSPPYTINVNALQPGLLAPASFLISGKQYVVAQFSDGSFVLPPGTIAGATTRQAKPGETVTIYGVGFGPVKDAGGNDIPAGTIVTALNTLARSFSMTIGGSSATLVYDGLATQFVGLYQFNVTVPSIANNDFAPLTYTLNGTTGPQTLYLAVHN